MTLAEALINEFTKGIRNALRRNSPQYTCPACDLAIPRYPGRYPKKCPDCGVVLERVSKVKEDLQNAPVYSEYDAWDAEMRRIPQDRLNPGDQSVAINKDDDDSTEFEGFWPGPPDKERVP